MNLEYFFKQWLYKPGTLKYKGPWQYNARKKEVTMVLDQVQTDGSFFKMPFELGIYGTEKKPLQIKKLQIDEKTTEYTFSLDFEPTNIVLDPNSWVLMDADFEKK